ncbi:transcriptional regulator [Paenibacillus baekrokdamisoli]|uniref:Transcriptional regulator n=1 Tax=Paenibacillus baekrokdamisoli TaxID=1712516 RepID=A0A3G9J6C0_9BACL|nr:helix-turn-helix transcriptional regulator [Paenibacillus baekrokdamisoli]MBB3072071.1 transcriptional regulator with XRE-family HTH domain [Paenibacillus baekrokdamisoli]BBH20373.1 transcriptional regulator [Paenibacillus baekrokdamisoli]
MAELMRQIGKQIRILRKNRGLTQEQLGEGVQLPQSYIGGIERGEKNISIETLERIIHALKINPGEVLGSIQSAQSEKEKSLDSLKVLLLNRSLNEIEIIIRLSKDVLVAFDAKKIEKTSC